MDKRRKIILNRTINAASITFKAFNYETNIYQDHNSLWHFNTQRANIKKYVVHCVIDYKDISGGELSLMLKKIPYQHRLIIVSSSPVREKN